MAPKRSPSTTAPYTKLQRKLASEGVIKRVSSSCDYQPLNYFPIILVFVAQPRDRRIADYFAWYSRGTSSRVWLVPAKGLSGVKKSIQWHSFRSRMGTQGQFQ